MDQQIACPKCGSHQIGDHKRGVSIQNAAIGAAAGGLIAGGPLLGAAVGGLAGSNQIMVGCLSCGHTWRAGEHIKEKAKLQREKEMPAPVAFLIGLAMIGIVTFLAIQGWWLALFIGVPLALIIVGILMGQAKARSQLHPDHYK